MKGFAIVIGVVIMLLSPMKSEAAETLPKVEWEEQLDLHQSDEILQKETKNTSFSLTSYVSDVMEGKADFSFQSIGEGLLGYLGEQVSEQRETFFRILLLGIFAGVFVRFAGALGDSELGETGFYIVFLLLTGIVSSGFYLVYEIAHEALTHLVHFMETLVPSFSLALCYSGGSQTSLLFYQTMLAAMGLLEMIMTNILLPGVQIYFFLNVINQLAEHRFSKMVSLIGSLLRWSVKIMFASMIGYQGIQGMLVPVMDKVKNNAVWQTAKGLPGVGNTVGSVMDTLLGSGVLIKSAIGIGGVIGICVLCVYPLLKLLVFTLVYKVGSAVIQPVSDGRVVAILQSAATSGKILLLYVLAGALMFTLSITIVLVCTNMTIH